jgi:FtsH-binding integral membrane protein
MFGFSWFIVLALFMGVSFLANWWAHSSTSKTMQYLGLGLYVVAEAIIFVPLLFIAANFSGGDTIVKAGIVSLGLFAGLTATVFITRKDFSFLGPILTIGGFIALGFIAASLLFGFSLGSLFAFIMVGFAATAILYSTSNVLHQYHPSQHVAASLSLFASVALLFWYILTIFNSSDD